ncbi:hypothetical protein [Kitasatospora aureofaciens]|uniref:hypothetical protein n=1 Tax=Kitasatospora aureofaciens TaxID=1894 RepID=UPI003403C660
MIRRNSRTATDHTSAAAAALAARGTWVRAGVYASSLNARTAAYRVRNASPDFPAYVGQPGDWEAYVAPAGDEDALWVRFVGGEGAVPPLPDRMTVRICDRGDGRDYVGVRIVSVTISTRCAVCGGPRGWDTVRNHNFHEDGDWYAVDRWTNPCGHIDMYAAVLTEARRRPLPTEPAALPLPVSAALRAKDVSEPVALILAAVANNRMLHAYRAADLLDEHSHDEAAAAIRAEVKARKGHMSAHQAAHFLHGIDEFHAAAQADMNARNSA